MAASERPSEVDTFLLEVGVEELPVSFLHGALEALPRLLVAAFEKSRIACGPMRVLGTPRRLAVLASEVPLRQPDRDEVVIGPPASVAFDADGKAKPAALGFARKFGVSAEQIQRVETPKGPYASVRVQEPGQGTTELLEELVPELLRSIPFPKVMRWGHEETAFGRPVQWLIAMLGSVSLETRFAGVASARHTFGHRFLAPERVALEHPRDYVEVLRNAHVLVDLDERAQRTATDLHAAALQCGGAVVPDAFLMKECASLVEWPVAVPGTFDEKYLALPEEVVVSVMRDHQRYFALRDSQGALLPRYLNIVNTAEHPELIQLGNDRVLRARLEDANFFLHEDRKTTLEERVPQLDRVTFHRKLGSLGDKVRRLSSLAQRLIESGRKDAVSRAVRLCKADLVTLMVGEFPELQGDVGSRYAREDGVEAEVCDAIADHYLPKGADEEPGQGLPRGAVGAAVAVADRVDTMVGIFGIGLEPSGSADPFALRRAAIGLLRIALYGPVEREVRLRSLLAAAYDAYPDGVLAEREALLNAVLAFVMGRVPSLLGEAHARDTLKACEQAWDGESLHDLLARVEALTEFRTRPEFSRLVLSYRRAHNITDGKVGEAASHLPNALEAIERSLLEGPAEQALVACFSAARDKIRAAAEKRNYSGAFELVVNELGTPIDAFFEEAFVMADDLAVRRNRLLLLGAIRDEIGALARLESLQVEDAVTPGEDGPR